MTTRLTGWCGVCCLLGLGFFGSVALRAAPNNFADIIRKTDPQPPEMEQKSFHLPPGFQIDLVAAEPQIGKPINMAFDSQGRLWLTQSREYPFPAPTNRIARDAIKVLSDFHPDGQAGKITTFATNLNIPIGIYPYRDGAMGYSIPNIYHFRDTNGDGVADTKEVFLGKFSFDKDTHGMTSSFRRGFDGLFYANHGFNNTSTLTARDGSTVTMHSGNTYRLRMDGTHLEQFVWGRVNPFGLMFDPLGNLYSSDCETWPIYQLLRGGYYPSFGIPDDGLGFAPPMMDHKHGSTAIAGVVYYAATNFPPEFRDNIFVGNVMTCRIDRDTLEPHGSTLIAREAPDFLSCDDPWFRPVDLELGPDGAIYMADFYNRIIGHYEVSLDHPGRDRERGRVWRIRYVGTNGSKVMPLPQQFDLYKDSTAQLIKELGNENITLRMLAMSELTDRIGASAIKPVTKMLRHKGSSVWQRVHGLWVLYRLNALPPDLLAQAADDPDRRIRVHAMRIYAETHPWTPAQRARVIAALRDPDALVERCAGDALGQHPAPENMRPLLDARAHVPDEDTHLLYGLRVALRNQLREPAVYAALPLPEWSQTDGDAVADVSVAVPSAASAEFLLHHMEHELQTRDLTAVQLRHITRYLPEKDIAPLADVVHEQFADDVDLQLELYHTIQDGLAQRGSAMPPRMRQWGVELVERLLSPKGETILDWQNFPVSGLDPTNPWTLQRRTSADGVPAYYITSLPAEKETGMLRSRAFVIPAKLSFFLAGHDGPPNKTADGKNYVQLVDAETGLPLRTAPAPRVDLAQQVVWDLKDVAGKRGFLDIVDGESGTSFSWIAAGRFTPEVVPFPTTSPNLSEDRVEAAAALAGSLRLDEAEKPLAQTLADTNASGGARVASAKALAFLHPGDHVEQLGEILRQGSESLALRQQCALTLAAANTVAARTVLVQALPTAPQILQTEIALDLASSPAGAEALLDAVAQGKGSGRLLQDRNIRDRLSAAQPANLDQRLAQLTKGLPAADAERQKIIDTRAANFNLARASAKHGAQLFQKNCVICHAIAGKGASVGPNLDGIGNRGVPRVVEDILDPSRNVDRAFRVTLFTMKDGDVQSGLFRREEGETVVVAGPNGKETSIPKRDIAKRRESELSLMPDNFAQILSEKDFDDLLAFLISKNQKKLAGR